MWFQRELKEEEKEAIIDNSKQLKTTSINFKQANPQIDQRQQEKFFVTQQARKYQLENRPNMFKPHKKELIETSAIENPPELSGNNLLITNRRRT